VIKQISHLYEQYISALEELLILLNSFSYIVARQWVVLILFYFLFFQNMYNIWKRKYNCSEESVKSLFMHMYRLLIYCKITLIFHIYILMYIITWLFIWELDWHCISNILVLRYISTEHREPCTCSCALSCALSSHPGINWIISIFTCTIWFVIAWSIYKPWIFSFVVYCIILTSFHNIKLWDGEIPLEYRIMINKCIYMSCFTVRFFLYLIHWYAINKTDRHDIAEILLKKALNIITISHSLFIIFAKWEYVV
jgi:hypothetical protein